MLISLGINCVIEPQYEYNLCTICINMHNFLSLLKHNMHTCAQLSLEYVHDNSTWYTLSLNPDYHNLIHCKATFVHQEK